MRSLVFLCLIFTHISVFIPAQETTGFTPLANNERFAYTTPHSFNNEGRGQWVLHLFAVQGGDIENAVPLIATGSIRNWEVQFTSDFKKAFFINIDYPGNGISAPDIHSFYMANGLTGEVKRLMVDTSYASWRVSRDGQYILFQSFEHRAGYVNLHLFDVENEAIVDEFIWRPDRPARLNQSAPIQAWEIRRHGSIFRIYATTELGFVAAIAEFDPASRQVVTLWSTFEMSGLDAPRTLITRNGWMMLFCSN